MCTRMNYFDGAKKIGIVARTMDFASATGTQAGEFKAREYINPLDPLNKDEKFTTKNNFKAKFSNVQGLARMISDGINDKGLSLGTLWLPQTSFAKANDNNNTISGVTLPQRILGMCSTLDDVIKLFNAKPVDDSGKLIGDVRVRVLAEMQSYATIHIAIADLSGKQYVIEFEKINGKDGVPVFYPDPFGVLTNAPKFAWHLENLRNYVGATEVFNITEGEILGVKIGTTGFGDNLRGLPGDATPPSRYVRAVILKSLALKNGDIPNTVTEAIVLLEKLIAQAVVVKGTSANKGLAGLKNDFDYTQWTSFHDQFNYKLYQKSADSYNIVELACPEVRSDTFTSSDTLEMVV